jgi:hypothetical protein
MTGIMGPGVRRDDSYYNHESRLYSTPIVVRS